jgi:hypothetical protein
MVRLECILKNDKKNMTQKDYERVSKAIWRAGFIKDKNKVRQQAKTEITRLIVSNLIGEFKEQNTQFNEEEFLKECRL